MHSFQVSWKILITTYNPPVNIYNTLPRHSLWAFCRGFLPLHHRSHYLQDICRRWNFHTGRVNIIKARVWVCVCWWKQGQADLHTEVNLFIDSWGFLSVSLPVRSSQSRLRFCRRRSKTYWPPSLPNLFSARFWRTNKLSGVPEILFTVYVNDVDI